MITAHVSIAAEQVRAELSRQLLEAGATMHALRMVPATSGNLSARLPGDAILITASGAHKGRLTGADLLCVGMDGIARGRTPSAETPLHLQIYRRFPEVGAVLHAHSIAATLISMTAEDRIDLHGYELQKAVNGVLPEDTLTVPVFANDQDTAQLADRIDAWMERHPPIHAYLLAGHGVYTWGRTVADALRHVEALDHMFECELTARGRGRR
jgi:methylthioribulose-1-phosphate dehydratase